MKQLMMILFISSCSHFSGLKQRQFLFKSSAELSAKTLFETLIDNLKLSPEYKFKEQLKTAGPFFGKIYKYENIKNQAVIYLQYFPNQKSVELEWVFIDKFLAEQKLVMTQEMRRLTSLAEKTFPNDFILNGKPLKEILKEKERSTN